MKSKAERAGARSEVRDPGPRSAPEPASPFSSLRPYFGGPFRDFENVGGVHLTDSVLWCDADRRQGLNFRSSAAVGELGRHRRVLCTEATHRLMSRGKGRSEALTPSYDQRLAIGELELSLHPSGHMLGSAQLRVVRGNRTLVYAGDICGRSGWVCPPAEAVPCDVLALPATFGQRGLRFPARDRIMTRLERFLDKALEAKGPAVLLVPPFGVGPEVVMGLGRAGYKLRLHRAVAEVMRIHADLGVRVPRYRRLGKRVGRGEVVLVPPILRAQLPSLFPGARIGFVGPRAVEPDYVHRLGVDEAFALSNVADHTELLEFVHATGAREVFLTGGAIGDVQEELRERGLVVRDLLPQKQLTLF